MKIKMEFGFRNRKCCEERATNVLTKRFYKITDLLWIIADEETENKCSDRIIDEERKTDDERTDGLVVAIPISKEKGTNEWYRKTPLLNQAYLVKWLVLK